MSTVICFLFSFPCTLGIQYGWRSVQETTYTCQIIASTARVVEKETFRETALIFKSLKCERLFKVKSTFSSTFFIQFQLSALF